MQEGGSALILLLIHSLLYLNRTLSKSLQRYNNFLANANPMLFLVRVAGLSRVYRGLKGSYPAIGIIGNAIADDNK